jgi:hypothetical protein
MNRVIDVRTVRTEVRKLAGSKPVYAVAGVGVLAGQALRQLPARLAKLRNDGTVSALPSRAAGYMLTARAKAAREYDRLASHGHKVLNGHAAAPARDALNGKPAKSPKRK